MKKKICVVGTGFSGAVIAREIALSGYHVEIFEERDHIAGNCHTHRDRLTNIMVHTYGPHIFHTKNQAIWNYVKQFDEFNPFINRVKAIAKNAVYSLPINLMTINQFFGKSLSPSEAKEYISSKTLKKNENPKTFEDQALHFIGNDLYETFFKGYTKKQWGVHPSQLPASILKRLPIRFNYNDNYFSDPFQGIPKNGYTYIIEKMIDHKNIKLNLECKFERNNTKEFEAVFYSGPIDDWFGYKRGRLPYRTLKFDAERYSGDFQGNAVINYCDEDTKWTRITEHKHFAPEENHQETIIYKEFSKKCKENDIPYYPLPLVNGNKILSEYLIDAKNEKNVYFIGRLGTYRYLNMDVAIEESLNISKTFFKKKLNR